MAGYPECDLCPFKDDPDRTCHALATGTRRICEMIEAGHRWKLEVISKTMAAPPRPRLIVTGEPVSHAAVEQRRIDIAAIDACPDRGEKIGDGCNCLHRCRRGHGSGFAGEVSLYDCQDCLDGNPRAPALGKRIE